MTDLVPTQQSGASATVQPLDQHPAAVFIASLGSENSRRNMRRYLNQIAGLLTSAEHGDALAVNWAALRFQHTAAIRARLMEQYAPATVNCMLSALRGTLKAAWKLGQMTAEDYQRAANVENVKGETIPVGREITMGEIQALVQACKADKTPAGARDAALIGVLYAGGLRRAEAVALDLSDYDRASGKLTIRSGKGRKGRTAYLKGGAKTAVDVWLVERGLDAGALFTRIRSGNRMTNNRLTSQGVYHILQQRGKEAGVHNFTPHDFRRTLISTMLDRGVDIVTVSKIVGHADVKTTARYDRRAEETKSKAAETIHYPF
jgi:integrase/recombinase XerC